MIPERIILHCSATKDSGTVSWGSIRKYHIEVKHSLAIGYHFGIENINGQLEILMGRMPNEVGAHCKDHNVGSIGICVVGDYDTDHLTLEHEATIAKLLRWLMAAYRIPIDEIYGHRDFNKEKSCPGEYLYSFLRTLKAEI